MDEKTKNLVQYLPKTKLDTYRSYEIERKEINQICLDRSLAASTLHSHLETAVVLGLPLDFERLGITMGDISTVEKKIRQPPINANVDKLGIIKEQLPTYSWEHLKIIVALLKRKYGLCPDADGGMSSQQTTLDVQKSVSSNVSERTEQAESGPKSRELPSWMKRAPSDHDLKSVSSSTASGEKDKAKKKPKLL